jgi:foldase protein PrsA
MAKIKIVASKLPKIKIKTPNFKFSKESLKKYVKPIAIGVAVILAFILIDLFVQYLNNDYSIAVVNGSRISRDSYHKKLETLYGQTVAAQMIDENIIKQEAKKADISATKEEIQKELDTIISDVGGQETYESVLKANGIEEKALKDQLELNIITRKIMELH